MRNGCRWMVNQASQPKNAIDDYQMCDTYTSECGIAFVCLSFLLSGCGGEEDVPWGGLLRRNDAVGKSLVKTCMVLRMSDTAMRKEAHIGISTSSFLGCTRRLDCRKNM